METVDLSVEVRNETGKGNARRLRARLRVPGVFYGPHLKETVTLTVNEAEIRKILRKGGNVFLSLKCAAEAVNGKVAVVKDEQFHPLSGELEHVDFYEVRMDEEIKVHVPLAFTGKSKGVSEGGVLQVLVRELEVRCLPLEVPLNIPVDVTEMDVGDSIHLNDLKLPTGVKTISTVNFTIAAIVVPAEEVVETPVVTAEAGAALPGAPGEVPAAGAVPGAPGAAPGAPGAAPAAAGAAPGAPGAAPGAPGAAPAAAGKGKGKAAAKEGKKK